MTKKQIVNTGCLIMGILGMLVLCLPWYELNTGSEVAGFASTMNFGSYLGIFAVSITFFGYGLYILPAAALYLGVKSSDETISTKAKGMALAIIGALEVLCFALVNKEMSNSASSMSGDGFSAWGSWDGLVGIKFANIVYIATIVVGVVLFLIALKEKEEIKTDDTTSPYSNINANCNPTQADASPEENAAPASVSGDQTVFCTNCGNKMPADAAFCSKCGTKRNV